VSPADSRLATITPRAASRPDKARGVSGYLADLPQHFQLSHPDSYISSYSAF